MKCAVIARHRGEYPLALMCRVLQVARSAYYAWQGRGPSRRSVDDQVLSERIRHHFERTDRDYGSPRIRQELRAEQHRVGRDRIARLMREMGLSAAPRRRFVVTTQSDPSAVAAPNRLARQFAVGRPNERWVADITYCHTREGWLYLAAVLDVGSRRVVGWATGATLEASLVQTALDRALAWRRPPAGLLHHSDRGRQYSSTTYQARLAAHGVVCSMSRVGNCWDNAVMESFFSTLKRERVRKHSWASRSQLARAVAQYIDGWYNRERLHSALGYLSPIAYEAQFRQAA